MLHYCKSCMEQWFSENDNKTTLAFLKKMVLLVIFFSPKSVRFPSLS